MTEPNGRKPVSRRPRKMAREPEQVAEAEQPRINESRAKVTSPQEARRPSKTALVLELLGRAQGASIAQLVDATGWLPHTTRAALTGLRKKGHVIARSKAGDVTCYRISAEQIA